MNIAIIVAAGSGSRMGSKVPKQYIEVKGHPILYYTLRAFQNSFIDEIILVVPEGDQEYCQREFVERYGLTKVKKLVAGGANRYDSVYKGLVLANDASYVYIHDGARPFIKDEVLGRLAAEVTEHRACVAAVPVKDTIKIADQEGYAKDTPDRSKLWAIQTPQVFEYGLIKSAYDALFTNEVKLSTVTDDAMVVELMTDVKVKLVMGDYTNNKITTPDDLLIAELYLKP